MSQWVLWPAVAVALLAPMAVARRFRLKACPKCGSPKVWIISSRNQAVIGWVLFIVGVVLPGWWHLLMAAGLLAIVTAPANHSLGFCIACRQHWHVTRRARRTTTRAMADSFRGAFGQPYLEAKTGAQGR